MIRDEESVPRQESSALLPLWGTGAARPAGVAAVAHDLRCREQSSSALGWVGATVQRHVSVVPAMAAHTPSNKTTRPLDIHRAELLP